MEYSLVIPTLSTSPIIAIKTQSELPPEDTKGKFMPVFGNSHAFMAVFVKAWKAMVTATPVAISLPKNTSERCAIIRQRKTINNATAITATEPMKPSSAPITENKKSFVASGIKI